MEQTVTDLKLEEMIDTFEKADVAVSDAEVNRASCDISSDIMKVCQSSRLSPIPPLAYRVTSPNPAPNSTPWSGP